MKHNSIKTSRSAFYYSIGNTSNPRDLWIVCHGYAQTADDFINPFQVLTNSDSGILAPEGLSRFYREGNEGEVVSSWMTKRYRLYEIQDQIAYLNKLYEKYNSTSLNIHVLGFSQGVATVTRWLAHSQQNVNSMILWAGWPPDDIDYASISEYWDSIDTYFIYGERDRYLTDERIKAHEERKDLKALQLNTITFDGGHRVSRSILKELQSRVMNEEST